MIQAGMSEDYATVLAGLDVFNYYRNNNNPSPAR